jgi:hypothetical protein
MLDGHTRIGVKAYFGREKETKGTSFTATTKYVLVKFEMKMRKGLTRELFVLEANK